jgi:hypothetical protein
MEHKNYHNAFGKEHNRNTNRKIMGTQWEHNGNTMGTQLNIHGEIR